jgi:hypothetical protein
MRTKTIYTRMYKEKTETSCYMKIISAVEESHEKKTIRAERKYVHVIVYDNEARRQMISNSKTKTHYYLLKLKPTLNKQAELSHFYSFIF